MTLDDFEYISFHTSKIDRSKFSCSSKELENYFKKQLNQDIKSNATKAFVAVLRKKNSPRKPYGFATLAAGSISPSEIPEGITLKLRKYPQIPVVLLGRLAVDLSFIGKGLGKGLLMEALYRVYQATEKSDIGVRAVVVDAKDSKAESFYKRYGFLNLTSASYPRKLLLPIETIIAAIS